jgi:hypothetical protein
MMIMLSAHSGASKMAATFSAAAAAAVAVAVVAVVAVVAAMVTIPVAPHSVGTMSAWAIYPEMKSLEYRQAKA